MPVDERKVISLVDLKGIRPKGFMMNPIPTTWGLPHQNGIAPCSKQENFQNTTNITCPAGVVWDLCPNFTLLTLYDWHVELEHRNTVIICGHVHTHGKSVSLDIPLTVGYRVVGYSFGRLKDQIWNYWYLFRLDSWLTTGVHVALVMVTAVILELRKIPFSVSSCTRQSVIFCPEQRAQRVFHTPCTWHFNKYLVLTTIRRLPDQKELLHELGVLMPTSYGICWLHGISRLKEVLRI